MTILGIAGLATLFSTFPDIWMSMYRKNKVSLVFQ